MEDDMYDYDSPDPSPLERGDRLFINNRTRKQRDILEGYAYFGYKQDAFFIYSKAYLDAADRLVRTLDKDYSDFLTLPIVFLYRQYMELMLKDLIIMGNEKYGNPPIDFAKHGHNIDRCWNELKPLLLKEDRARDSEEFEAAEACILEFSHIDDSSFTFRYPVNKTGKKPTLVNNPHLETLDYIDLHHLAKKMERVHAFFMGFYFSFLLNYNK